MSTEPSDTTGAEVDRAYAAGYMDGRRDALNTGCECDERGPDVTAWHGGNADGCPREAYDHPGVITSPALCLPCLHGCAE